MPFLGYGREPRLRAGALCSPLLLLAALLAGCASKNPLMDDAPVVATASQARAGAPAVSGEVPEGVHTTRQRRFLGIFSPYRPDIQQGNFVSREMVAQLKTGMTPDQVRFVLGSPMLTDMFHAGRWDYPFRLTKGNGEVIESRVTVYFQDQRLARIVGGDLPTEEEYLALIEDAPPAARKSAAPPGQQAAPTTAKEPR
jgi:outer membrane protein assembly factor BamE